ncbi:MAG: hypothetical protein AAF961_12365, partial [Planctomycetota bacterium]
PPPRVRPDSVLSLVVVDGGAVAGQIEPIYVLAAGRTAPSAADATSPPHLPAVDSSRELTDDAEEVKAEPPTAEKPPAPAVDIDEPEGGEPDVTEKPHPEKRPLSTFMQPAVVEAEFRPALEVDQFGWSGVCRGAMSLGQDAWRDAVEAVSRACDEQRTLVGVAGAGDKTGCTTVIACLARMLAGTGRKTVVVDGCFSRPNLARELGVEVEVGWGDVLAGRLPLDEVMVQSLNDKIAMLPLAGGGTSAAELLESMQASTTAGVLRRHYDVVLVDLGSLDDAPQAEVAGRVFRQCRIDAVLLNIDDARIDWMERAQIERVDAEFAEVCLGVIHNASRAA